MRSFPDTAFPGDPYPGAVPPFSFVHLAERITTPLLPADYLDVINPLLSGTRLRGRIVAIRPETPDTATLVIKPGRGWRPHIAGQYLRVRQIAVRQAMIATIVTGGLPSAASAATGR